MGPGERFFYGMHAHANPVNWWVRIKKKEYETELTEFTRRFFRCVDAAPNGYVTASISISGELGLGAKAGRVVGTRVAQRMPQHPAMWCAARAADPLADLDTAGPHVVYECQYNPKHPRAGEVTAEYRAQTRRAFEGHEALSEKIE